MIRRIVIHSTLVVALLLPAVVFAHGGMREVKGTITAIESESIVIERLDGKSETVPLASTTTYKVGSENGTRDDMHVGSRAVVHFGADGKALEIHLPKRK